MISKSTRMVPAKIFEAIGEREEEEVDCWGVGAVLLSGGAMVVENCASSLRTLGGVSTESGGTLDTGGVAGGISFSTISGKAEVLAIGSIDFSASTAGLEINEGVGGGSGGVVSDGGSTEAFVGSVAVDTTGSTVLLPGTVCSDGTDKGGKGSGLVAKAGGTSGVGGVLTGTLTDSVGCVLPCCAFPVGIPN